MLASMTWCHPSQQLVKLAGQLMSALTLQVILTPVLSVCVQVTQTESCSPSRESGSFFSPTCRSTAAAWQTTKAADLRWRGRDCAGRRPSPTASSDRRREAAVHRTRPPQEMMFIRMLLLWKDKEQLQQRPSLLAASAVSLQKKTT